MSQAQPSVVTREGSGAVRSVALLLHGGRPDSFERSRSRHLAVMRMAPFARTIHRAGERDGVAVWTLLYRFRGWNGPEISPVHDTRWALEEVRRRHGDVPVVLIGHSMGGRTGLRVAGDPSVRGVAALAPWLPEGEPTAQLAGRHVLIAHGREDARTDPKASARYAAQARRVAAEVIHVEVDGEGHAMLRRSRVWHRLTVAFVLDRLGLGGDHTTTVRTLGAAREQGGVLRL